MSEEEEYASLEELFALKKFHAKQAARLDLLIEQKLERMKLFKDRN